MYKQSLNYLKLISIGVTFTHFAVYSQGNPLINGFKNPPLSAKPRALWAWVDGNFDKESITYELKEAKEKGLGGFDIWDIYHMQDENNIVPRGKPFMGEEYTDAIAHAVNEATKLDLELGLIVSSGWNSGGAWTKPEHATMGIYRSELVLTGGSKQNQRITFPITPKKNDDAQKGNLNLIEYDSKGLPVFYKNISVIAFPITKDSLIKDANQVIDISTKMDADGNINWIVPAGQWKIVRMICANTGQPMICQTPSSNGPMIDHFNPQATEIHIQYFIDKLLAKLGTFNGKALKYL